MDPHVLVRECPVLAAFSHSLLVAFRLWSSVFMHVWFVCGAAGLNFQMARPQWILAVIIAFTCSHVARLYAYEHRDTAASFLEFLGMALLVLAVVNEILGGADNKPEL